MTTRRIVLSQLGVIAAALLLWEGIARSGLTSPEALPPFSQVVARWVELLAQGEYWSALVRTLLGAFTGFAGAAMIGVPMGVVIGSSLFLEKSTRILTDFGRSFPAIALLPVFVLLYGSTVTTKTVVVLIGAVFPIFMQSFYGARRIDPAVVETARAFRIPRTLYLTRVGLPAAVPSIMTGLRLGITMSVLSAIGAEILAGIPGLGREITAAQQDGAADIAFAYIITASLLGFLVSKLAQWTEHRLLRWRPPSDVA